MFSTSEGYHEYIGRISWVDRGIPWVHQGIPWVHQGIPWVHQGIPWVHQGMFSTLGGYHEYIGGISWVHRGVSWVHRGMFSTSGFSIEIERILSCYSPTCIMISLQCTEHPPHVSWYPSNVLNIPLCTHGIPSMYSWYSPTFIMISFWYI